MSMKRKYQSKALQLALTALVIEIAETSGEGGVTTARLSDELGLLPVPGWDKHTNALAYALCNYLVADGVLIPVKGKDGSKTIAYKIRRDSIF